MFLVAKSTFLRDVEVQLQMHRFQVQMLQPFFHLDQPGWRAFYNANGGAIPIECQAGRVAMGMEAEATRLVQIGEDEEYLKGWALWFCCVFVVVSLWCCSGFGARSRTSFVKKTQIQQNMRYIPFIYLLFVSTDIWL